MKTFRKAPLLSLFRRLVVAGFVAVTAVSCSEINCPLDNIVVMTCGLYSAEQKTAYTLTDTLTVKAAGLDSILLNRAIAIQSFALPVRQGVTTDTLLLCLSNERGQRATDSLFIDHTNEPHFESIDCPPSVFHTLRGLRWTSHPLSEMPLTVDSVAFSRPLVNYDDVENIKIYLRSTAE